MVAIKGHFDGRAIVLDEPVQLSMNQRVAVLIQPIDDSRTTDFKSWVGLATREPCNPSPRFRSDSDLWE